jgi:hypothetical protein
VVSSSVGQIWNPLHELGIRSRITAYGTLPCQVTGPRARDLFASNAVIVINGAEVAGAGGVVVALISFFCAAILLLFVLAGLGVIVLGFFVFIGMFVVVLAFPFLLPLLIPLAILWLFIAIARRTNPS